MSFPVALNSFIHIIMYTYYFFALFDSTKAYANMFKKYITIMQMVNHKANIKLSV